MQNEAAISPLAHKVPAACQRLGVGRTKLYELIRKDQIKVIKFGKLTLIPDQELVRLVREKMQEAA